MPLTWPLLDPAELDLTGARVYTETGRVIVGGRWHVLADGRVVHHTVDGNWQLSVHDAEALADPARFTRVTIPS